MRKLMSRIRALFRRPRPDRSGRLTRTQSRTLERNLREILLTKESLSERNETAA